ncbi:MAG: hypothetical protein IT373_13445 [Polyangiaceae bacterium]|nr:hypothetical protein [Polyangiaceae bacterium]
MSELELKVVDWLASGYGEEAARATTGSLQISVGEAQRVAVTEIEDSLAQTVRAHINVPLYLVAEWLLVNWWRLRWEGRPQMPGAAWRQAHCLSGIGGDTPWPPLELFSDGDFVRLQMDAEGASDVSAIRYLRSVLADVAASDFEAAVDRFVDVVQARLSAVLPKYRDLTELREELTHERSSPSVSRQCRWQALAGIDPGAAPDAWLLEAQTLIDDTGPCSGDEVMGVLQDLDGGIESAKAVIDAMKGSSTTVDLAWVGKHHEESPPPGEQPWQRGARLARELRATHRLGEDVLDNKTLSELVSTPVPLQGARTKDVALGGGFRNGVSGGRARLLVTTGRTEGQRFFLARMIGAAHVLSEAEHLVPVTRSYSALQKLERSFAQELLCPWASLDAFTDDRGMHDEALAEAAEHFQVSEWLVRSTLVNRHKLSRYRLPP